MQVEIKINYYWKCDSEVEIPEAHKECLETEAQNRIFEMMADDYIQGELFTSIRFGKEVVPEEDEEDGLSYSGWWSITKDIN